MRIKFIFATVAMFASSVAAASTHDLVLGEEAAAIAPRGQIEMNTGKGFGMEPGRKAVKEKRKISKNWALEYIFSELKSYISVPHFDAETFDNRKNDVASAIKKASESSPKDKLYSYQVRIIQLFFTNMDKAAKKLLILNKSDQLPDYWLRKVVQLRVATMVFLNLQGGNDYRTEECVKFRKEYSAELPKWKAHFFSYGTATAESEECFEVYYGGAMRALENMRI
ncbi:hypothetical protein JCM33374_g5903 [Metschnikowia sp. JCM 33374]|nr:hypothetical protein JCM33374_g5903 [Metschnikowia sp. JCM 33374]